MFVMAALNNNTQRTPWILFWSRKKGTRWVVEWTGQLKGIQEASLWEISRNKQGILWQIQRPTQSSWEETYRNLSMAVNVTWCHGLEGPRELSVLKAHPCRITQKGQKLLFKASVLLSKKVMDQVIPIASAAYVQGGKNWALSHCRSSPDGHRKLVLEHSSVGAQMLFIQWHRVCM